MAQATTAEPKGATLAPEAPTGRNAVARIPGPRLPYHPLIGERFGVDPMVWKALCESIFPLAKTTNAIALALAYCKARNLDVMKKPVHIVPMWNSSLNAEVETVWPGIGELRTTAFRTRDYAGADPTSFGPMQEREFQATIRPRRGSNKPPREAKAKVKFPEWAQITIHRFVHGQKVSFPGPRVYWLETYGQLAGTVVPNDKWTRSASYMLEKCAEAAALRKAFPEEIGEQQAAEEMEGRVIEAEVNPAGPATGADARPNAADYREGDFGPSNEGVIIVDDEDEDEDGQGQPAAQATQDGQGQASAQTASQAPQASQAPAAAAAPAQDKVARAEAAAAASGISGEGLTPPADDPRFQEGADREERIEANNPQGDVSESFRKAEVMVEGMKQSVDGGEVDDDLDGFLEMGKTNIREVPGLTDDERDDLRAQFVSHVLQRKKQAGVKKQPAKK